jgi:hypothetical protein
MLSTQPTGCLNDVLCCRTGPHNLERGEVAIAPKKQLKAPGVDLVGGIIY